MASYDAKNLDDFEKVTASINGALDLISLDHSIKPTKANLAKISGVHRNTLYKRSVADASDGVESGWPFRRLKEIAHERRGKLTSEGWLLAIKPCNDAEVAKAQLKKSRLQVSHWFGKALQYKTDRDEARRHVELLVAKCARLEGEVIDLQEKLRRKIKLVG